ncbi:hypothetical protein PENTCL1PPCAC_27303, partial [Pristionchus entomophagus]
GPVSLFVTPLYRTLSVMSRLSLLIVSFALISGGRALTCFENDEEGNIYSRTNEAWKYCMLTPFGSVNGQNAVSGIAAMNENLRPIDVSFGQNSKLYKVLTVCIYEKYSFNAVNAAFGDEPEFMFRCYCNTDGCNEASTFSSFLTNLRKH